LRNHQAKEKIDSFLADTTYLKKEMKRAILTNIHPGNLV
jgi:hypothetical protein